MILRTEVAECYLRRKCAAFSRLGRISYVNMAPVFYRLEADGRGGHRRPDRAEPARSSPARSTSRRSRRSSGRGTRSSLRLLPRLCVSSEGAVDSIQLVSRRPLEQVRRVAVTPESATSVVLTKVLLPEADHVPLGEEADATLLIGDAALKSAFEDPTPHHDLGRLWLERTGLPMVFARLGGPGPAASGDRRAGGRARRLRAARPRRARAARVRGERALRLPGRLPRAVLREAALPLRAARARRAVHVPGDGARRRRARRRCRSCGSSTRA